MSIYATCKFNNKKYYLVKIEDVYINEDSTREGRFGWVDENNQKLFRILDDFKTLEFSVLEIIKYIESRYAYTIKVNYHIALDDTLEEDFYE